MKFYSVDIEPVELGWARVSGALNPSVFTDLEDARDHARAMARENPGLRILIIEGEPIEAMTAPAVEVSEQSLRAQ